MNVKSTLYLYVAGASLAVAACQPNEGLAERAARSLDEAAQKINNQADKSGDKAKDTVRDAKK
jgi:hypothetical protein